MYERNLKLKFAIIEDGRPQYRIAQIAGIDPSVLSQVVAGRYRLADDKKISLAAVLSRTVEELFG